jgi:RNA-binding protein
MSRSELKSRAKMLKPILRLGKNGLNESVVLELKKQLKKRKLVKIRLLKSYPDDKKSASSGLEKETGAEVIDMIGNVIVLFKDPSNKKHKYKAAV